MCFFKKASAVKVELPFIFVYDSGKKNAGIRARKQKGADDMSILIRGGRVLDPASGTDAVLDILIEDGKIQKRGENLDGSAEQIVDARGWYVMPGLVDMHVHLRDPGLEYKEDIQSGSLAAAKGGFTTIVAMPNTKPVIDEKTRVEYVVHKAQSLSPIHVLQAGAITKGMKGQELSDIRGMQEAGICALTEDGKSVLNTRLYLEAMRLAAELGIPVLAHCEDAVLAGEGCMNEDERARELHLPGISNAVEDTITSRDLLLAREAGVHLHLCHCSTEGAAKMLKIAREAGIEASGEVCPHHFTLTSADIPSDDPNYKMNPPLRQRKDVETLKQLLKEDVIQVISTDHAPHSAKEKSGSMRHAPFGIVGLETSVALTLTELVEPGILTPLQMAEKMSYHPAKILHIDKGTLSEGKAADIVLIDPNEEYTIDKRTFVSKASNTPFHGKKVKGRVRMTICDGKIVYEFPKSRFTE